MCPSHLAALAAQVTIPHSYRLAPASTLEVFSQNAIVFLEDTETFVTVNLAAADLFAVMHAALGTHDFDRAMLTALLLSTYELDGPVAVQAADRVLAEWTACGILATASAAEVQSAEREMHA